MQETSEEKLIRKLKRSSFDIVETDVSELDYKYYTDFFRGKHLLPDDYNKSLKELLERHGWNSSEFFEARINLNKYDRR